mgnify:CR=1 FL=1
MYHYAIGDIHGCLDSFRRIMADIDMDESSEPRKIILLGDYIDRGPSPNSKGVLDLIIKLQEERGRDNIIALQGNYEDMAIHNWRLWQQHGGPETEHSYADGHMSIEHHEFIRKLPLYYETVHNIFVHAGIDDQPFIPMDHQSKSALLWKRFQHGYNPNITKVLVHGHTPVIQIELLPNRVNLDTGCVFNGCLSAAKFGSDSGTPIKFFCAY